MFNVPQFQSYMTLPTSQRTNQGGGMPMPQPNMAAMQNAQAQQQANNPLAQASTAMNLYGQANKAFSPNPPVPQNPMNTQQPQPNPLDSGNEPMTIGSGAGTQDTTPSAMSGNPLMGQNALLSSVGRPMVDAQGNQLDQSLWQKFQGLFG